MEPEKKQENSAINTGRIISGAGMINILIVDDQKILREGLIALLRPEADFNIVGEAENGQQAMDLAGRRSPDVVIMDIDLGEEYGVTVTGQLLSKYPAIKVVGFSIHDDTYTADAMFQAGAAAHLSKSASIDEIITVIRSCVTKK